MVAFIISNTVQPRPQGLLLDDFLNLKTGESKALGTRSQHSAKYYNNTVL